MSQKSIKDIAYEKYQLIWMSDHGYTIENITNLATEWYKALQEDNFESIEDFPFAEFLDETGFAGSEIYAAKSEFLEYEYQNVSYMQDLLSREEFLLYIEDKIQDDDHNPTTDDILEAIKQIAQELDN